MNATPFTSEIIAAADAFKAKAVAVVHPIHAQDWQSPQRRRAWAKLTRAQVNLSRALTKGKRRKVNKWTNARNRAIRNHRHK